MESPTFFFVAMALALSVCISCSTEPIHTDEIVPVSDDSLFYTNTVVSVDPSNNRNMAIGAIEWENINPGELKYGIVSFISNDGGRTWNKTSLPKQEGQTNSNFPSISYSSNGVLYLAYSTSISGERGTKLVVHRSMDKGKTWNKTSIIKTLTAELPKLTIHKNDRIYVVATGRSSDPLLEIEDPTSTFAVMIAESSNDGETFELSGTSLDNNEGIGPFSVSIFEDGSKWLPFLQFIRSEPTNKSYIYGLNSFSKKEKMEDVTTIAELPRRIPYISNNTIDMSGQFKDRLYITYLDGMQDSLVTAVRYSDDRGRTWSESRLLTAKNKGHYSRLPVISSSKNGTVGILWAQRESSEGTCWRAYFSYSTDGANTFSEPSPLSENASCPDSVEGFTEENSFFKRAYGFGGDYMGLSATEKGFQATWIDLSKGSFQVHSKHINLAEVQ